MKLSELKNEDILFVCTSKDYDGELITKEELINDLDYYKKDSKLEIYTTKKEKAHLDANDMLVNYIENEECDHMYDEWGDYVWGDITEDEINQIQNILDKILDKHPEQNMAYHHNKLIEIDM